VHPAKDPPRKERAKGRAPAAVRVLANPLENQAAPTHPQRRQTMNRWEYYFSLLPAFLFIIIYVVKDNDHYWLFLATFVLINAKANQIRADIKEGIKA
jgi:hypothetical protein